MIILHNLSAHGLGRMIGPNGQCMYILFLDGSLGPYAYIARYGGGGGGAIAQNP